MAVHLRAPLVETADFTDFTDLQSGVSFNFKDYAQTGKLSPVVE